MTRCTHKAEKRLIYFVTEDWYFLSHRLELARAATQDGFSVTLVTNTNGREEEIIQAGIDLIPLKIRRRSLNPFHLLLIIGKLVHIYSKANPLIVHNIAMFPVIVGGIAARITGLRRVINTLPGTGYVFSSNEVKSRVIRPFFRTLLRKLLTRSGQVLIMQNQEDREWAIREISCRSENVKLIKGSGVDMEIYKPHKETADSPVVIMASRMIWDKGVGDFVEAAKKLRSRGVLARFVLVGDIDEGNPNSVSRAQLESWDRSGVVEWWGFQRFMPSILAKCHIFCLPSAYGEGIPKVLIEAAACGLPIVATNIAGCREVVTHGLNGLLIPAKSPIALADALNDLLQNQELRVRMGNAGREFVKMDFSLEKINHQTLDTYHECVS